MRQPTADEAWLATLTVLYVEDDETTRKHFARFLSRRVGVLLEASDGVEGLAQFRAHRPALVVTDIEMPGMDGLRMAEEIHRLDANVSIVVITAFEQVDYLRRAIDAGINHFVAKPVDVDKLEAVLGACARRLRAEALLARARQHELDEAKAHEREALGMLAGGMAHDFNNVLQAVVGGIDLASTLTPPDSELSELINLALDSARQAGELSRQLVTLSDGWGATLRVGPLEPTLRAALATGELTLRVELAPDLPPVPHDQELLRRAFVQLVENAREAMDGAGTLTIRGEVRQIAEDELAPLVAGAYVQLTFRDSGPGIAPEILPRIFQPYFSTKPRGATRGMGLGLSLCQAILQKHGGLVTATSLADGGALFTVLLPVSRPETEVYVR